jgi:hypothetical protein
MHLRHIDPRSTDWLDAMVDEGKAEAESEMEAMGEGAPVSAAPESGLETRTAMAAAPPR